MINAKNKKYGTRQGHEALRGQLNCLYRLVWGNYAEKVIEVRAKESRETSLQM